MPARKALLTGVSLLTALGLAPVRAEVLSLSSASGMALLTSSEHRRDFAPLVNRFITQATLSYCGVASAVMVLNSLNVPSPPAAGYRSYRFWTQDNLFDRSLPLSLTPQQVGRRGMTLAQLAQLLNSRGVDVTTFHASELSLDRFRSNLVAGLNRPDQRVLVNYLRPVVGQQGGGHISPIAAWHAATDQVLLLDVARYRYPAGWIPVKTLWEASRTVDSASGKSRGLVIVQR